MEEKEEKEEGRVEVKDDEEVSPEYLISCSRTASSTSIGFSYARDT